MNDLINGGFEFFGSILLFLNVKSLMKYQEVKGVSWIPVVFFTVWGIWNLYYYPSLNQWFSFLGGCSIVFMNTWWLFLVVYYRRIK